MANSKSYNERDAMKIIVTDEIAAQGLELLKQDRA